METLESLKERIARGLIEVGAILTLDSHDSPLLVSRTREDGSEERGYRLQLHRENPDAPLSPFFFNLRGPDNPGKTGNLTPELFDLAAQAMARVAIRDEIHCTHVVGVPNAGKPFAQPFLDYYFPRPGLLEMEKAGDAIGGFVGLVPESGYVLGIDDLITKAKSKLPVIERVRAAGMAILDFVVLINRGQGGGEELAGHGVTLHSVFDVGEVIGIARELGSVSKESYEAVRAYLSCEKLQVVN